MKQFSYPIWTGYIYHCVAIFLEIFLTKSVKKIDIFGMLLVVRCEFLRGVMLGSKDSSAGLQLSKE